MNEINGETVNCFWAFFFQCVSQYHKKILFFCSDIFYPFLLSFELYPVAHFFAMITSHDPVKTHVCSFIKTTIGNSLLPLFYARIALDSIKAMQTGKNLHQLGERLASLGIMGARLRGSLKAKIRAPLKA